MRRLDFDEIAESSWHPSGMPPLRSYSLSEQQRKKAEAI
jgi:hypothetical protein